MERAEAITILRRIERRWALRQTLSLGALTLLTGCEWNVSFHEPVQNTLAAFSHWNDRVRAALFDPNKLAPTFDKSQVVKSRYNAWYGKDMAPRLDAATYKLELAGAIADKRPWSVRQLHALPQQTQITRHVCVEGWSYIGEWTGTPLRVFLERVGADLTAKYVGFVCADGYYESMDMPSALQPQTIMAFKLNDQILPCEYGFPFKIRIPTKLGFKGPKFVTALYVTNNKPRGFWEDRGYNWFSGS